MEIIATIGRFEVRRVSRVDHDRPFEVHVTDGGHVNSFETKAAAFAEARTCAAEDFASLS